MAMAHAFFTDVASLARVVLDRNLVDKLNADGDRGYQAVDAAWRDAGTEGRRAVDVVLARNRD